MNACLVSGVLQGVVWLLATALAVAENGLELAPGDVAATAKQWVIVLDDPRPARLKGWPGGVGYRGNHQYADDPRLKRLVAGMANSHAIEIVDQWPVKALNVHCLVVTFTGEAAATLATLHVDQRVAWVQPLNSFEGLAGERTSRPDPYRNLQSSLVTMNIEPLRSKLTGAGIRVAVIDSAVEADHPDLHHALVEKKDFVGQKIGRPAERHGTGIVGVLAAAYRNGEGITGIAPDAEILAYRACWETPDEGKTRCNSLTLSRALDRLVSANAHILNLSLTGPKDRLLESLIDRILTGGTLVVAAFDAQRQAADRFPSPRDGILMVRNGTGVTEIVPGVLYAPGEAVLTTQPGHSYDFMSGHSMAAAHVSGILALMLEDEPAATSNDVLLSLTKSVRLAADAPSLDACAALNYLHLDTR